MTAGHVDKDFIFPLEYIDIPLTALRSTTRDKLGQYLDLMGKVVICLDDKGYDIDLFTNYTGLAELAGFNDLEIKQFGLHRNPTQDLLDSWIDREGLKNNAKVGDLWRYLRTMKRYDVLKDCGQIILNDCKLFKESAEDNPGMVESVHDTTGGEIGDQLQTKPLL